MGTMKRMSILGGLVVVGIGFAVAAMGQPPSPPASSSGDPASTPIPHIYVAAFQAVPPFQPQSDQELLQAFNKVNAGRTKTHHFVTRTVEGIRFGYICVNGEPGMKWLQASFEKTPELSLSRIEPATPNILKIVYGNPDLLTPTPGDPPRILFTVPYEGEMDVDVGLSEVTVTFDRDMGGGMSWTGGPPQMPTIPDGTRPQWRDKQTCVLPVKLEPGRQYRVGINAPSFQNFRSAEGIAANPSAIVFTTKGTSSGDGSSQAAPPTILEIDPPHGATGVDPRSTKEIRITFDQPMAPGFSWCGGGPDFPTIPEGMKPQWMPDRKTCVLPVALKPNWTYKLGINCPSAQNFRSESGVPSVPFFYQITTGP